MRVALALLACIITVTGCKPRETATPTLTLVVPLSFEGTVIIERSNLPEAQHIDTSAESLMLVYEGKGPLIVDSEDIWSYYQEGKRFTRELRGKNSDGSSIPFSDPMSRQSRMITWANDRLPAEPSEALCALEVGPSK